MRGLIKIFAIYGAVCWLNQAIIYVMLHMAFSSWNMLWLVPISKEMFLWVSAGSLVMTTITLVAWLLYSLYRKVF